VSSFATAAGNFKVYLGTDDVTASCTFAEVLETNCTGTVGASTGAYSVTALSADNGAYKMSATYGAYPVLEQIFTLSKSKAGAAGTNGSNGSNGTNGLNNATVFLYQRNSGSAPSVPSTTSTYTFATGGITGYNNGWSDTIPSSGGVKLWAIRAVASSNTATDTIATGDWSSPGQMSVDGVQGGLTFYQSTTPSGAVTGDTWYNTSTNVWSRFNGSTWDQMLGDLASSDVVTTSLFASNATGTLASSTTGSTVSGAGPSTGVTVASVTMTPDSTASVIQVQISMNVVNNGAFGTVPSFSVNHGAIAVKYISIGPASGPNAVGVTFVGTVTGLSATSKTFNLTMLAETFVDVLSGAVLSVLEIKKAG
jgi:hypothetical protein